MSDSDHNSDAFEYVTGTLRGEQRQQFERLLIADEELQQEVSFWEQQLMSLQSTDREVQPNPNTWDNIIRRIGAGAELGEPGLNANKQRNQPAWMPQWLWAPGLIAALLLFGFLLLMPPQSGTQLNADYVAVLSNDDGDARLTAITASNGETLWLQWSDWNLPEDGSAQLWAVSRRDGESRSIAVFENEKNNQLVLNETALRLIRDASHLVLTEEELGGSAIDEPSEIVLAKGVCVRLGDQNPS